MTLTDLDQGLGTAPDPFVIDDATGGLLRYDVGSPAVNNVVSFGGYVPGGDNLYGRCKSLRMFFAQPLPSVFFTMWISRAQAGNSIRFDLRSGGQTMGSFDIPIPAGTAPFCLRLNPFLPNMEEIVVTGIGPHDGGAFHGVIDGMLFGVVVDYAPTCDGGVSPIHAPCPCGNDSNVYDSEGCLSSFGNGGRLRMSGYSSISNDDVQLVCMKLPPSASALFFQGTQDLTFTGGAVFGDGVRCAAGNVLRLGVKQAVNGIAAYPEAGDVPISIRGGVTQGSVRLSGVVPQRRLVLHAGGLQPEQRDSAGLGEQRQQEPDLF